MNHSINSVCPPPAPVPVWGTEEAAVTGHGADHLTGQQLVSALPINTLIPALWLINNQLNCHVWMQCVNFQFNNSAVATSITCRRGSLHEKWTVSIFYTSLTSHFLRSISFLWPFCAHKCQLNERYHFHKTFREDHNLVYQREACNTGRNVLLSIFFLKLQRSKNPFALCS